MKCQQIREKVEALGLDSAHLNKKELIHAIQLAEGNFPCFLTARRFCDQINCCWRDECLAPSWCYNIRVKEVKKELQTLMTMLAGAGDKEYFANKTLTSGQRDMQSAGIFWEEIVAKLAILLQQ